MIVFTFDYETGAYTGRLRLSAADADPRSPGTVLLPGNATIIEPPRCGKNLWPFFRNGGWQVFELIERNDPPPQPDPEDYWSNWMAS